MKKQRSVLMKQIVINNDSFGSVTQALTSSASETCIAGVTRVKCPMDMTKEELKYHIKMGGREFCNKAMGVASCGDDQRLPTGEFSTWSPFNRWYYSGGRCAPNMYEERRCTTGCRDTWGYCY